MNFSENQSIYIQITEFVKEQILLNKWQKEEKIPSVRDLAAELQVNPNTVMRAYDFLQQQGVIYNRRGLETMFHPMPERKSLKLVRRNSCKQISRPSSKTCIYLRSVLMNWNAFIKISQ